MKFYDLAGVAVSLALGLAACSSDDSNSPSTGSAGSATSGTGGSTSTAGGASSGSSGGASGASGGSGGNSASGSTGTAGTAAGSDSGAGGGLAGSGGASGSGGAGTGGGAGSTRSDGGAGDATSSEGGTISDAGSDVTMSSEAGRPSDGGGLMLTSTALAEGMTFSAVNTCAGANTSPPLSWSGGPADAKSYALVLTDTNNNLNHWVVWDLPATVMSLPAALTPAMLPTGALESSIGTNGAYSGPCPNGTVHRYIFEIYPLDVAKLPNVTATTSRPNLVTAIKAHQMVPPASLSGTSNAARP